MITTNYLNVLAIDPAQRCGFAWSDGLRRHSGIWDLGHRRGFELRRLIFAKCDELPTDVIAFESAGFGSHNPATKALHEQLAGVIIACADELGLKCWAFNPGTWKVRAVGHGRPGKGRRGKLRVMELLKLHHGIDVSDDNEADAIGLLLAAQQGPPPLSLKKERKRVAKVVKARQPTLFRVK